MKRRSQMWGEGEKSHLDLGQAGGSQAGSPRDGDGSRRQWGGCESEG